MSDLILRFFSINLNVDIGTINEKKATAIANSLQGKFETSIKQENTLVLANTSRREAIIVESNSIVFQSESNELSYDNLEFEDIKQHFKSVMEALLLDNPQNALIRIVGNLHSSEGNSMSESLKKLSDENVNSTINNLKGVGLRFIIEGENGLNEYKVEPQINDPSIYFIELLHNINGEQHSDYVVNEAALSLSDFADNKKLTLKTLGLL